MRVGAAVGEGHELREGVGAFGPAEEGRGAALGCGDCGVGELGAAEEGAVETHFGCVYFILSSISLVLRWMVDVFTE